jgi:hypothetical protein
MSSESLEDKPEVPEHEENKVEELLKPVPTEEEDDVKTPYAQTQETFHDGPSVLVEDIDEDQEPDAS